MGTKNRELNSFLKIVMFTPIPAKKSEAHLNFDAILENKTAKRHEKNSRSTMRIHFSTSLRYI